jgi:segregation and condensation protein B
VTVPEISEIRGVDSGGVIATLLDRKLITTAGRKAVIGRPILYKTSKEFLLRFGLKDVHELPSMEEFEKLLSQSFQDDLIPSEAQAESVDASSISESKNSESEISESDDEPSSEELSEVELAANGNIEAVSQEGEQSVTDDSEFTAPDLTRDEKRNAS